MTEFDSSSKRIELVQDARSDQTPSPQYLCVDETKRPRANSDPVGLHIHISTVPEITVTGDDCRSGGRAEDDENDSFLIPPSPRRRANTCPEDMFRTRKGRPPTPPPMDIRLLRNPAGKRFSFNFNPKDVNSVSFAHHRLSKVSEEKTDQQHKVTISHHSIVAAKSSTCGCSSAACQTNDRKTNQTSSVHTRLQLHHDGADTLAEQTCDRCVSTQLKDMSVEETANKKPPTDKVANSDVLTSSPDSWRSKDNTIENLDSQRLTAY